MMLSSSGETTAAGTSDRRQYPFPYKAMLAICSDLDETPSLSRYIEIARFLNTDQETTAGRGVALEVGNTIYFDMPDEQFAYWNTDDRGREIVRALIRSGHIDCFHSFGDLAISRQHAARTLEELDKHGCRIECWVDHATAPTNLGSDIMQGAGDVPGSSAYHADLSFGHGVRFVWRGRITSVIGQDRHASLAGLFSLRYAGASARTVAAEAAKQALARVGNVKYGMHAANELLRPIELRDGRRVLEFMRCNPHFRGVSNGATADGLEDVLTTSFLDRLARRRAASVLYTHLGKTERNDAFFGEGTVAGFRRLADSQQRGDVLVTTTRRLLGYRAASRYTSVSRARENSCEVVRIDTSLLRARELPVDLSGLSFYVADSRRGRILVDGEELEEIQRNPPDESGRESVGVPWSRLSFPDLG